MSTDLYQLWWAKPRPLPVFIEISKFALVGGRHQTQLRAANQRPPSQSHFYIDDSLAGVLRITERVLIIRVLWWNISRRKETRPTIVKVCQGPGEVSLAKHSHSDSCCCRIQLLLCVIIINSVLHHTTNIMLRTAHLSVIKSMHRGAVNNHIVPKQRAKRSRRKRFVVAAAGFHFDQETWTPAFCSPSYS